MLEYRVKDGWDAYLPAEGILILHVDYDSKAWDDNSPNNLSYHQRMTIIPADNQLTAYTNKYDTWPRDGLDSLTNNSVPAAAVYTGGFMRPDLTGDVNDDGEVNIADVNALIDMILSGTYGSRGDVNSDGEVNIGDVNALIDIILTM